MNNTGRERKLKNAATLAQAYKTVFSSKEGEIVLIDLMRKCRVLQPVTDVTNANGFSVVSSFNDGKRSAVLDIFNMLGFAENRLIELFKLAGENQNEF